MKCYKGFDKNLECRGFKYNVGKSYEENDADICSKGFHACEYPLDVFSYYPPAESRYCEVDLSANNQKATNDTKRVGKKIKICAEIGLFGLAKASVEYIKERLDKNLSAATNTGKWSAATNTGYQSAATNTGNWSAATNTGNRSAATNTGDQSAATNTGYQSAATNTGDQSAATNTGNWSAATNTGYQSAATNTGNWSAATVEGKESVAISLGIKGKAKGDVGCFIVLAEWEFKSDRWHRVNVKSAIVDGNRIKPNKFYSLNNGEFVEVE